MDKITVRGIPFDNVNMAEALALGEAALDGDILTLVATPNAEIAEACLGDEALRTLLCSFQIILPDGAGVVLSSRILGTPLREKVAGVEFGEGLLALAARRGDKVFFLGGKPNVAETAARRMTEKYAGLSVVGTHDGYFEKTGEENREVIEEINRSGATVLFVCLGAPLQETWLYKNRRHLKNIRLGVCLGGSLDIYAGTAKRAPEFFIRLRCEWLYRLLREPRRFGRMLALPRYILGTFGEKRRINKNLKDR